MCCPQAFYAMASCCNAAKLISSWFPVQGCASPPNCFAASAISRAVLVIRSHSERQQREIGPQQAGNDGSRFEIPAYQPRDPTQVADFRGSDGGSGRMAAISPITRGEATAAAKIVLLDQWV